ncbi:single-stranded-DNA-specific exonuclease RecJ [Candidatus Curtissbacteria bacterium RBG_13_35_7]|uniref:Single-stranded-DNA-specific exonuclease RecJ n=1 Tax=Candidatus Curtissbacteria bacterium RBG_13_35_7 TaxID=1797705 RepID=A0A1F5G299_9BACT|nr:MAG: single-stranded-DNA-specific exonuclease RecJ [Candidatus Curtissbacteria bacterium RBG_13_35_7]
MDYKWKIISKTINKKDKNWLTYVLAKNRGLYSKKQLDEFLCPNLNQILNLKLTNTSKAVNRIIKAIKNQEKIIVYSDYDADGICGSAIVWETLYDLGADIIPYVPDRIKEGYGLYTPTIKKLAFNGINLIITVDHGISAVDQISEANKLGVDVIVTDHHVKPKILPKASAIVHSTNVAGAGVAWRFCYDFVKEYKPTYTKQLINKLELAAIATIADLVPLIGENRAIVKIGLEKLQKTKRPGLVSLLRATSIKGLINSYDIGHIIAPRINAMGRIKHGIDALRLICAKKQSQADSLASLLSKTNVKRQDLTTTTITSALEKVDKSQLIGVIADSSWHEGIIGLVASRLVEFHYKPMVVISVGQKISKGSARSIPGFNIIEAIRQSSELLVDAGGHPMAAGFTIKSIYIEAFSKKINAYAQKTITEEMLAPSFNIECQLDPQDINKQTLELIKTFEPFGVANPSPIFLTKSMTVEDLRGVGNNSQHLKLQLNGINAIGFNLGEKRYNLRPGYSVDIVFTLEEDNYNNNNKIQINIKDLRLSNTKLSN